MRTKALQGMTTENEPGANGTIQLGFVQEVDLVRAGCRFAACEWTQTVSQTRVWDRGGPNPLIVCRTNMGEIEQWRSQTRFSGKLFCEVMVTVLAYDINTFPLLLYWVSWCDVTITQCIASGTVTISNYVLKNLKSWTNSCHVVCRSWRH